MDGNKKSQIKEKVLFPFLSLKTSLDIIGALFGNFWLSKRAQFSGFCAPFGNFLCPFWKLPMSKGAQEIAEKGIGNCRKGHSGECEKGTKIAEKGIGNCRKGLKIRTRI